MNDDNKRISFKKLIARIGSLFMTAVTLLLSCGNNAIVVHAAETETNTIHVKGTLINVETGRTETTELIIKAESGYEICAFFADSFTIDSDGEEIYLHRDLAFRAIDLSTSKVYLVSDGGCTLDGSYKIYDKNGNLKFDYDMTESPQNGVPFQTLDADKYLVKDYALLSGSFKTFNSRKELEAYASTGSGDYLTLKPDELEKNWYLKNVQYERTADDSPTSEAGGDATYVNFTWDTDNLQEGDLLEIKTYSYYSKIGGEKLSGFHDYITKGDNISAYSGAYSCSQYEATKAWFNSLESKPLVFKDYDTTDYYLRPYRQGQYGGWVHIKLGRDTPTSSPHIEDVEYGDFDDDNNWTTDEDLTEENGGHYVIGPDGSYMLPEDADNYSFDGISITGIFSYFYDFMKSIPSMLADLPALVSSIISFLPAPIIGFIGIAIVVVIILRIVGR